MDFIIIRTIVIIVVFFICRELVCWYFKINERLQIMKKQYLLLTELCRKIGCDEASISRIDNNEVIPLREAINKKSNGQNPINELKEKFEASTDKEEKRSIAFELVELGETYYKKYLR